jgi:hypothetical protein
LGVHKKTSVPAFDDHFLGDQLDTTKWFPFYLPHWSSRQLARARFSLADSALRLYVEEDQPPWCPHCDGDVRVSSLQTGCFSGPIGTSIGQHHFRPGLTVKEEQPDIRLYTPRHGYFETRLKAVPVPGYMVSLWMIGFEDRPERSAEICICEIFGDDISPEESTIGYGIHPFGDASVVDDFHRESFTLNAANYHVYAAGWDATRVTFYIDDVRVGTLAQSPTYPMQLMLGIYELPDRLRPEASSHIWPKAMEVDYVRGYAHDPHEPEA